MWKCTLHTLTMRVQLYTTEAGKFAWLPGQLIYLERSSLIPASVWSSQPLSETILCCHHHLGSGSQRHLFIKTHTRHWGLNTNCYPVTYYLDVPQSNTSQWGTVGRSWCMLLAPPHESMPRSSICVIELIGSVVCCCRHFIIINTEINNPD